MERPGVWCCTSQG